MFGIDYTCTVGDCDDDEEEEEVEQQEEE